MKKIFFLFILGIFLISSFSIYAEEKIVIDGSTTVGPLSKAFTEYFKTTHPQLNISISESGSGNGAKSIMNGTCDIANMSRFMKDSEFKAAANKGIMPVAHVVALDGIAVVVHPANPVKAITMDQLKAIYSGKMKSWKELGGPDQPIKMISRDTNSGTYETFTHLVMGDDKIVDNCEYVDSNGAIRSKVQTTQTAIGYIGLGFLDTNVKALTVNGVYPANKTVSSGKYPIARPLYMFTNGYPKMGTPLYEFVTFYLSKKGQEIVSRIGFVPVTEY